MKTGPIPSPGRSTARSSTRSREPPGTTAKRRFVLDTSKEWDRIFSGLNEEIRGEDAWLERWRHVLEASRGSPVLDLGCGAGHDARFLTGLGFPVVAADFSEKALEITRRMAPAAKTQNVDLTRGLPFPDAQFRGNRREPLATLLPLASDHSDPGRRPSLPQTRRPTCSPASTRRATPVTPPQKNSRSKTTSTSSEECPSASSTKHDTGHALRNRLGDAGSR